MKTIIFDLDGTLADIKHRRKFLENDTPDWKSFNELMGDDTINDSVANLYKILWCSGEYEILIVTGRNEEYRSLTEQWLTWNQIPFKEILMRPDKDFRPDHQIKEEMLNGLVSRGKNIEFVVDDRNQVVEMWRRNGITCLQCDEGDF